LGDGVQEHTVYLIGKAANFWEKEIFNGRFPGQKKGGWEKAVVENITMGKEECENCGLI